MKNPFAGKKAKVLWRAGGSTALQIEDPHDDVMVIVDPDGSMMVERIAGLASVRETLEAASPYDKVLVPDDTGQKKWERLDAEPAPKTAPVPERWQGRTPTAEAPARAPSRLRKALKQALNGPSEPEPEQAPDGPVVVPDAPPDVVQAAAWLATK